MAENTIDNLSIEVTASVEKAERALNRLASSANNLRNVTSGAAGGMRDAAQGAQDMGTATQQAGTQSGKAEANIRNVGRAAQEAGEGAKKGSSGINNFWQSLKRVAYYRMIRNILKGIANAFKEGAQNLYQWSARNSGLSDFKKNMDRIASSALYLKNSLGAMLEPLVRILTPIIEWVVDKLTWLIDKITQFFAALTGAQTYTAAKKVATTWGEVAQDTASSVSGSARDMAEDIKRTILGFDEINKLDKPDSNLSGGSGGSGSGGSSGPNYNDMFEERALDGWAKAISDFVNKLKEWVQPILDFFDTVGDKIKHLWDGFVDGAKDFFDDPLDWLKKHVADPITTGLRKLFGISSPSTEMKIIGTYLIQGLKEGMLNELEGIDEWIKTKIVDPIKTAFSDSNTTLYFSPKLDNQGSVLYNHFKKEWDEAGSTTLYFSPKFDNTASVLYQNFKNDWDSVGSKSLYFDPKLSNQASVLYDGFKKDWDESGSKTLYFSPKLDNTAQVLYEQFKAAWDEAGSKFLYFSPKMDNTAQALYNSFKSDWDSTGSKSLYFDPKLSNQASVLYNSFKKEWDEAGNTTLYFTPKLDNKGSVLWTAFKKEWDDAKTGLYASPKLDNQGSVLWSTLKKEWDNAKTGLYASPKLDNQGGVLWAAFKKEWDAARVALYASPKLDNTGKTLWAAFKKEWDAAKTSLDITVNVSPGTGFGGASGGGGSTSGGGAGRFSVPVDITLPDTNKTKNIFQAWWDAYKANAKFSVGILAQFMSKSGSIVQNIGSDIKTWLFGSNTSPSTDVTVTASAGTGFSKGSGNNMKLTGVDSSSVTVSAKPGTGFYSVFGPGNTFYLNGINDRSVNVDAILKHNQTKSTKEALNALSGGDYTKTVNMGFSFTGNGSSSGEKLSSVGSLDLLDDSGTDAITGATASILDLIGAFNKLKKTDSKTLKVAVKKDGTPDATVKKALAFKNKTTKTANFKIKESGSANGTVKNALTAPKDDYKTVSVGIGTDKKHSDTTGINVFKALGTTIKQTVEVTLKKVSGIKDSILSFLGIKTAMGGVFSNGIWGSIPQYAGGTTNAHGSMFLAGEAGPELVGHVGGRTEVLNRSQLAATMYSAVRNALSGVQIAATVYTGDMGEGNGDYETMYKAMYDAFRDALAGGEERDREKVALLRQISEKDFTAEVTASSIATGMTRMNRRAGVTIVPVGT